VPNKPYDQLDFSVGELSPDHHMRADLAVRARSLKQARNVKLLVGGSMESRAGTKRVAALEGDGQVISVIIGAVTFELVFTVGKVAIWDKATRALVTTLTGMDWDDQVIVDSMTVAPHGSTTYVLHQTRIPVKVTRAENGTWGWSRNYFATGLASTLSQPYFRYADHGVTVTPSALTGSITLVASAAYFDPIMAPANVRLRLQGREVQITAVADSTHATATVIQDLFPTRTLTLDSSVGFALGESVEGKDSTAKGEVVGIPSPTTLTVLMHNFTDFITTGTPEKVIGTNVVRTISAQSTTTPAAVLEWTEAAFSDFRGWAGTGTIHKNRLWLGRIEACPFGIAASAIGQFDDFEVGANDDDAIFETIGDESTGIVQHIVSAEQLIVLTSKSNYYYPESESNPIAPQTFELIRIGPDGSSSCRPTLISEGVLFAEDGGGSILGAFPTGDIRRSWRTADMSRLAAHLVGSPRCIAYVSGSPVDPMRYAYAANEDGSLAVVSYSETENDAVPGWVGCSAGGGLFRWVTAANGEAWAIVKRTYNATDHYTLEVFDNDEIVDGAVHLTVGALIGPVRTPDIGDPDQVIVTPSGPMFADFIYAYTPYAHATCSLIIGGDYIGEVTLDALGKFGVPDLAGEIVLGFKYGCVATPWPPMDADEQRARRRKRRIIRCGVRYQGKGVSVNGKTRPLYEGNEDTSAAAPERDELWWFPQYGWSFEPMVDIEKLYAAPWRVLGIFREVAG
jgi:hypothetical protein